MGGRSLPPSSSHAEARSGTCLGGHLSLSLGCAAAALAGMEGALPRTFWIHLQCLGVPSLPRVGAGLIIFPRELCGSAAGDETGQP
jgi:hypothetical protein